jgi:hypothetical protein
MQPVFVPATAEPTSPSIVELVQLTAPEALNTVNCDAEPSDTGSALAKPAADKAKAVKQVFNTLFFIIYFHLL